MIEILRKDIARDYGKSPGTLVVLNYILFKHSTYVVLMYRIYSSLHRKNPFAHFFSKLIYKIACSTSACDISPNAKIAAGFFIPHPVGIVIGSGVTIQENVTLYQNTTIGRRVADEAYYPVIKNNVTIYGGAMILGGVVVGENATIGAMALVLKDVEPNSIMIGIPAKNVTP